MKTKDLIRLLNAADPSGEEHCCIDNADIEEPSVEPAYYDGSLHIIERDSDGRPLSGRRKRSGKKVNLHPTYIYDVAHYPGFKVEYSTEEERLSYEKGDAECVRHHREIEFSVEMGMFCDWVFRKIQLQRSIPLGWVERIKKAGEEFYREHRGPDVDGNAITDRKWGWDKGSWSDRLESLWSEIIHVEWDNYSRIIIRFKEQSA